MAVFGYGRVSTKEQQSENQRLELERAGYNVSYWFADEGVSGKVPALPIDRTAVPSATSPI